MFIRKFYMCTRKVKIQLFKSYCSSYYCGHLWWCYKESVFKRLVIASNDVFRNLLSLPRRTPASQLFVSCNVPTSAIIIRKQVLGLNQRLEESSNNLIVKMLDSSMVYQSSLWKKWQKLLHIV